MKVIFQGQIFRDLFILLLKQIIQNLVRISNEKCEINIQVCDNSQLLSYYLGNIEICKIQLKDI